MEYDPIRISVTRTDRSNSLPSVVRKGLGFVTSSIVVFIEEGRRISLLPHLISSDTERKTYGRVGVIFRIPSHLRIPSQYYGGKARNRGSTIKICVGPGFPLDDGTHLLG